jgi:hypothetical protein
MSTETTAGGFVGDRAEAYAPAAATGGCCGSAPTAVASVAAPAADTCCGTAGAAQAEGACCAPAAKAEAVASGAGCCG